MQTRHTYSATGTATLSEDRAALHNEYFRTRDPQLREQLLTAYTGLARAMAKRFVQRGPIDDLLQVAYVGLLKAIDGFDPTRGLRFSTYAMPTILGELKRHLRDQSWGIRPPRRVHDLYLAVERTVDDLAQHLRRRPTVEEVAAELGVTTEQVVEAMEAATGRKLPSLDVPPNEGPSLVDSIACDDPHLDQVERSLALATLLCHLPARDQQVLRMRFEGDMTQLEIARALGRSQMQVSRALARGLGRLRTIVEVEAVFAE
jgi:RNA polymerase sigma-B factor